MELAASAKWGSRREDEWEFPDDADAEDEEDDEEEERVTGEELAQLQQDAEHIQEVTDAKRSSKEAISEAEDDEDEDEGPRSGRWSPKRSRKLFPTKSLPSTCSLGTPVNRMLVAWRTGAQDHGDRRGAEQLSIRSKTKILIFPTVPW